MHTSQSKFAARRGVTPVAGRVARGRVLAAWATIAIGLLAAAPGRAATDFLALRERLEVERPKLRAGLQSSLRAPDAEAFPADKPGVVFGKYLDLVARTLDTKTSFPEVAASLRGFRGKLDPNDATQRQALGVLFGDYLQVRYGGDLRRELRALVGFKTYSNIVDRNPDNLQVHACFDYLQKLATGLGLQAENRAYETLLVTLPASGAAAGTPALGVYAHADVPRPVEHKWTSSPYELTERNNRLYGAGVYDDKGPLVVNLFALRVLRDAGLQLERPIVLLVGSTGVEYGAEAASSVAKVTPKPALVLAADGEFPYATGELGRGLARVSSTRGMKTRAGIKPGDYFIHRMVCNTGPGTVPSEARVWVRYQPPLNTSNPSLVMVNKWRAELEAYQKGHAQAVYETYIQEDTLHFFVYGTPQAAQRADLAVNSIFDAAGALQRLPMYANSASDIMLWIDKGLQRDLTGKSLGLAFEDPEMGGTHVSPVGFDRLGDEVTALVDVRWPVGHDAAWVHDRMAAAVDGFNRQNATKLAVTWEPGGREPARIQPPRAVQDALGEAFVLASGESGTPVTATASDARLLPATIPFGPVWTHGDPQGHTRDESISWAEIQDLGVAYLAALTTLATSPLPATP